MGKRTVQGRIRQRRNERIKAKAGYCCRNCGRVTYPENLEVDHVYALHAGGEDVEENLQVLCCNCHVDKTSYERGGKTTTGVDGWPVESDIWMK